MKKALIILLAFLVGYAVSRYIGTPVEESPSVTAPVENTDVLLKKAFADRASGMQVEGRGTVAKILPDDRSGSRHQKFIVRLESGQTLEIAHNIDLAPPIDNLAEGDVVLFFGEYAWNPKGGVIHWTHRDPDGRHVAGWLQHDGKIFQ
jgi:hypothetical protein